MYICGTFFTWYYSDGLAFQIGHHKLFRTRINNDKWRVFNLNEEGNSTYPMYFACLVGCSTQLAREIEHSQVESSGHQKIIIYLLYYTRKLINYSVAGIMKRTWSIPFCRTLSFQHLPNEWYQSVRLLPISLNFRQKTTDLQVQIAGMEYLLWHNRHVPPVWWRPSKSSPCRWSGSYITLNHLDNTWITRNLFLIR
jgi:hypothetical protein